MKKNLPAISVLIPMYNSAKYIVECLDSVLAQTFDDYEVIVVDDCSTDNSVAIVESYASKFGGKLRLIRSRKNSGNPGTPRNTALRISRGEYIMFVDSDDAIIADALETLYKVAKNFDADVIHCEKHYKAPEGTITTNKNLLKEHFEGEDPNTPPVTKPTFESNNLEDRVCNFGNYRSIGYPWNKFIKRELLVKNNIEFPPLRAGQDQLFSFFVVCLAENILNIPTPVYVWRKHDNSVSNAKLSVEKTIHRWVDSTFRGVGIMDKFMNQFELFCKKPNYRHLIFETVIHFHMDKIIQRYGQTPATELDKFVRRELEEVKDKTALTAFFFARMNNFNLQVNQRNSIIYQMNAHIQKQNQVLQQQQATIQKQTMQIKQLQNIN